MPATTTTITLPIPQRIDEKMSNMDSKLCLILTNVTIYDENGNVVPGINTIKIRYLTIRKKQQAFYFFNKKEKINYQTDYNAEHKTEYLQYQKQYYQQKKKDILEKKKEKRTCECGRLVSVGHMQVHLTTTLHHKHLYLMKNKTQQIQICNQTQETQESPSSK